MNSEVIPDQNWVYTPEYRTVVHIFLSLTFWTLLYNILLYVPLPKYKAIKSSDDKPVELTRMEILDVQNRMVSFIHGSVCCTLSFLDITFYGIPYGSPNTTLQNLTL